MARIKMLPYILLSPDYIRAIKWQQRVNNEDISLQEIMPHWDIGMTLHLSVTIEVSLDDIRKNCYLASNDQLRAVIVWHSPGTNLRGRGDYVDLDSNNTSLPVTLALTLSGGLLADRVRIEVQIVLATPGKSNSKLSAHHPGSILWHEEKMIILEGLASRFPTELIDFAESSWLPEHSSWFLDWDNTDLNQMALQGLRLFINSRNPKIKRAVTDSLSLDEIIREIIQFDVGRTLIIGALENNAFVQNPDVYIDGSIGCYVRRLLRTLFAGESWNGIVDRYHLSHSHFECELQARFRLFQGV